MSNDEYSLIYWPAIPGRGEFVRLLFEETGTPYSDVAKSSPQDAVSQILELNAAVDPISSGSNPSVNAPPVIRHGSFVISQTPAILLYLAPRLGLSPPPTELAYHHLNAIALTLLDGFVAEMHDTHHPTDVSLTYEEQKPEALKRAKAYREKRIPKFLGYVQRVLDSKASGDGPWLYGDSLTYVDLVLFQVRWIPWPVPLELARLTMDSVFTELSSLFQRPSRSCASLESTTLSSSWLML